MAKLAPLIAEVLWRERARPAARWEGRHLKHPRQTAMRDDDPREAGPRPPQPPQQQEPPAHTAALDPQPDHGEQSYRGCGKLEGKAALITGADSGIGRA